MKAILLTCSLLCSSAWGISTHGKKAFVLAGPVIDFVRHGQLDKAQNYSTAPGIGDATIPMHVYTAPQIYDSTDMKPEFFPDRNSSRVKVRYGPFTVDPLNQHQGMQDELLINAPMPCYNCTITHMQASMEYTNGTYANANTSLWLHHMIIINLNRPDSVCGNDYYARGQRWFASGNERTPTSYSMNGKVPTGYYIAPGDIMIIEFELMNQGMIPQDAVPTIEYEWVEGIPDDFFQLKPIWMDIAGCHIASDVPTKGEVFTYASPSYEADFNGQLIGMGGHIHDGGLNLEVWQDVKYQLCNSVARYGETPGYIDAPGTSMAYPLAPMFSPMKHVSNMSFCYAPILHSYELGGIKNGTVLQIQANYNFTEWMPMMTPDGEYDDVMGIAIVYAAENMTTADLVKYLPSTVPAPLDTVPPLTGMNGLGMMPMGGDDDHDEGGAEADHEEGDHNMGMAGMGMGMGGGGESMPVCNPMRDSPGTITLAGLNTTDASTMNTLLTAILCDTCLQAWSKPYARYFWYGIVVVIGLFGTSRALTWNTHVMRKHEASKIRPDVYEMPAAIAYGTSTVSRLIRRVAYRQYTPTILPSLFKLPPMGIVLMVVGYFAFLVALQFTHAKTGDLQTYQFLGVRAAWLSVAQLPLIILLSAKRGLITLVTSVTYERLNVLHRWTARGLLMTGAMHFGFQWHGWVKAGVLQYELSDECIPTGAAALAMVLWMNLSTLAPFRNFSYEFFVFQHIITFFGLIIAVAYHVPSTAPYARTYVYVSAALYLVMKLYQLAIYAYHNISPARAVLYPISERITKVTIKAPRTIKSWAPGSFVRLSLPRLGLFQSHPASIASTPYSNNGDMTFYLLRRGGFTRKLANADMSATRAYTAFIDGPYGASHHDFAAYHTSILFAGSTGITFVLPILMDIAQRARRVQLPIRRLYLAWSIKEMALVTALRDEISKAVRDLHAAGIAVEVSVHVTGSSLPSFNPFTSSSEKQSSTEGSKLEVSYSGESGSEDGTRQGSQNDSIEKVPVHKIANIRRDSDNSGYDSETVELLAKKVQIVAGRPDLEGALEASQHNCEGEVGVAVCGPLTMSKQIRNKVATMQSKGGVYLHVEGFAW